MSYNKMPQSPMGEMAAEERRGPDRPLASHHQVRTVERVLNDLGVLYSRLPLHDFALGGSNMLTNDALRAAHRAAAGQILDAFGYGMPETR